MSKANKDIAVFFHQEFLDYRIPDGMFDSDPSPYLARQIEQPEGPDRILNTRGVLINSEISGRLDWFEPLPATDEELSVFHTREYIDRLKVASVAGEYLAASTYVMPDGMEVIRLSAGSAIGAAKKVVSGDYRIGYALSRPPGHHAQPGEADGYCFINGVGLAALEAIDSGFPRVAIIDWDVHHGNGTQAGFYGRDDVLTISMHMNHGSWGPTHPQSGDVDETGEGLGDGYNINLPIPFGAGDHCYNQLFQRCVVPAVQDFDPDIIVLANGQDANQFDPNGRQCLTMAGYYSLASQLRQLAQSTCDGRIIMTQEGGYNPSYAPYCAYAVVAGLLNRDMEIQDPIALYPDDAARAEREVDALIARHPLLAGR
jgi:acetoin utilization deacetylase AcuC-like enzyme